jgi:hypothetical protein
MKRGRCSFLPRARRPLERSGSGWWRRLLPLLQGGRLWCYPAIARPNRGAKRNHRLPAVLLDWLIGPGWQQLGVPTMASPSWTRLASSGFSGTASAPRTRCTTPWQPPLASHNVNFARTATESHARSIARVRRSLMVCGWNSRPLARCFIGGLLQLIADVESILFHLKSDSNSWYLEIESKGWKRRRWLRLGTNPVGLGRP